MILHNIIETTNNFERDINFEKRLINLNNKKFMKRFLSNL